MLLQTNSYVVPKEKRTEHQRLIRRFRQTLARLGCAAFDVYEQVGSNWSAGEASSRFVQMMRFRDRRQQQEVQQAERDDAPAQELIREFCELINFPYQQQQGLFAVGFYANALPQSAGRRATDEPAADGLSDDAVDASDERDVFAEMLEPLEPAALEEENGKPASDGEPADLPPR